MPPPGTIGLTHSYGYAAFRAALGQFLTNETATYNHAFIVIGHGAIIEPWPSGARVSALADFEDEYVSYCFLPDLIRSQRQAIASAAMQLDGIGYGMADYAALAAHRYRWAARRTTQRLASPRTLLPAQFVVEAYRRAGVELMPGFAMGDVTMADLGALIMESSGWELRRPYVELGWRRHAY
jgi:hypothetical protein